MIDKRDDPEALALMVARGDGMTFGERKEAAALIRKQRPEAAASIEALRPFSNYYALYLAEDKAPDSKLVFSHLTLGDFRRAAGGCMNKDEGK
jgi:hypothetical protein